MILSSGKVVGNVNVTAKEQWKEVKDNRVRNVVNQNTSLNNNGMEMAPTKQLENNKNKKGTSTERDKQKHKATVVRNWWQ